MSRDSETRKHIRTPGAADVLMRPESRGQRGVCGDGPERREGILESLLCPVSTLGVCIPFLRTLGATEEFGDRETSCQCVLLAMNQPV